MNTVIRLRGRFIAAGVAVAIVLTALLPGSWGTALAQTGSTPTATPTATPRVTVITNPGAQQTSTTVTGTQTATVGNSNNDGGASVSIPAGSMPPGSTVTVTQPPSFGGFVRVNSRTGEVSIPAYMNLEAVDSNGNEITQFDVPVTVRVNVPNSLWATVLRVAGTSTPTVKVQNINPATGETTTVSCTIVDAANGIVDCDLPHFSEWGLVIEFGVEPGADPDDIIAGIESDLAAPAPADTGMGTAETSSGATNPLAIALGAVGLAAITGLGARYAIRRGRA